MTYLDKEEKQWLIDEAKKEGCLLCGVREKLHFHHIRPKEKLFEIEVPKVFRQNIPRIEAEIAKCAVLCNGCHMRVHRGVVAPYLLDLRERPSNERLEPNPHLEAILDSLES